MVSKGDDCDPMVGDYADKVVTWGGQADIGAAADCPVSLSVTLREAELFSISFDDKVCAVLAPGIRATTWGTCAWGVRGWH